MLMLVLASRFEVDLNRHIRFEGEYSLEMFGLSCVDD